MVTHFILARLLALFCVRKRQSRIIFKARLMGTRMLHADANTAIEISCTRPIKSESESCNSFIGRLHALGGLLKKLNNKFDSSTA
jgi:hypothetical protein